MGLELGAVDYVTKPFRLRELLTRIAGILRRAGGKEDAVSYRLGNVYIDALKMKVWVDEKEVSLTALEYRLLLLFLQHPGQVLTRRMILERLWDVDGRFINDNTLTVYIKRIRDKIGDPNGERIRTVRGQGYAAEV
jgi:two-component system response regulator VicR